MKKATWAVCGVAAGYLFAPYIKKGIDWVKKGLINLKDKLDEASRDEKEEVPAPEESQVEEEKENPKNPQE